MPSAALVTQVDGVQAPHFKLDKDHTGHSGQVAVLLMHA